MGKIEKIRKITKLPRGAVAQAINNMLYFFDNSAMSMDETNVELVCRELRILTHTIEKGMSLPKVKKGFGKEKIIEIQRLLDKYILINNFNYDYEAFTNAIGMIKMYYEKAPEYGLDRSIVDFSKYEMYYKNDYQDFGIRNYRAIDSCNLNFEEFAKARHSSRWFDGREIPDELMEDVVKLAQTAPSACNRQSSRVIHIKDREKTKKILEIQGGAKGHSNSDVLLVVSDLSLYRYTSEIHTPYLDGGIFLMNLLYSLQYYKLNACPLIWDEYCRNSELLREIVSIPKGYLVVAIVQAGFAPTDATYAISKRRESTLIDKK